jgi:lipopolysaccharide assembly outer membrane protein LptD (OstA)
MKRHPLTAALWTLPALTATFTLLPSLLPAQTFFESVPLIAEAQAPPRKLGPLDIDLFRTATWNPDTNVFHYEGTVRLRYNDPQTSVPTVLEAEVVDYNYVTGELKAHGNFTDLTHPIPFRLTRQDAAFTGRDMTINVKDGNGVLTNDRFLPPHW